MDRVASRIYRARSAVSQREQGWTHNADAEGPEEIQDSRQAGVLAIFAHPDDESIVAGGTLAKFAAAGLPVAVLSLTRGEQGPIAPGTRVTRERLGAVREEELCLAARELGVADVECLGYPDGELSCVEDHDIEAALVDRLRERRPKVVITFGPEGLYWHPDHIAVHHAVSHALDELNTSEVRHEGATPFLCQATFPAGLIELLAEKMSDRGLPVSLWGLAPSDFGCEPGQISETIDVQPFVGAKLRALRCHASQLDPDHLFSKLPDDLAQEFLGLEYFMYSRPPHPSHARGDRIVQVLSI